MAEAILDLRLDTVQPNRVRLVYGVQNDYNSRYICARFTVNGNPIDIEKTAAVRINAKRPDGNKDAFPGTVNTDGTAKVPVAQWMLEVPGEVSASITAVTTGGALTTQEFYIMAKASIWDSTGEPSAENPDKDVLQTIIASENERVAAESTRVANENARKSAETARATAETKRIADEAERVANEAGRVSAEEIRREEFATWQDEWGKISSFDKRLENLEAAVSPGLVTPTIDDTIAYRKTVPKGVLPNAAVCEVGGMSYKCENLLDMSALDSKTISGVTFTKNSNGTYTASGTSTAAISVALHSIEIANTEKMWLSGGTRLVMLTANAMLNNAFVQSLVTVQGTTSAVPQNITYDKIALYLVINKGVTLTNETFYGMLNKGTSALPYQPYFEGLRDSKVTAIESVGRNIFGGLALANKIKEVAPSSTLNEQNKTIEYHSHEVSQKKLFLGFKPNTQYTFILKGKSAEQFLNLGVAYTDGTFISIPGFSTANTVETIRFVSNGSKSIASFDGNWNGGTTTLYYEECGIFEGGVLTEDFSPYFRETLTMPADALDGFGQGVNAEYCNKIVLDTFEGVKKYVRAFKKIKLKDLSWRGENSLFYASLPDIKATASIDIVPNMVVEKYTPAGSYYVVGAGAKTDKTICEYLGYLYVYDTSCSTVDEFLAALGDAEIVYQLATPTETDVSHLFTDDNLLPVEAGGTITAVNEYEQAVPFTIEYTVKGA